MKPNQQSLQMAELTVATQPFSIQAKVEVTPVGLLAIAALVSGILLGTCAIVWVAKR